MRAARNLLRARLAPLPLLCLALKCVSKTPCRLLAPLQMRDRYFSTQHSLPMSAYVFLYCHCVLQEALHHRRRAHSVFFQLPRCSAAVMCVCAFRSAFSLRASRKAKLQQQQQFYRPIPLSRFLSFPSFLPFPFAPILPCTPISALLRDTLSLSSFLECLIVCVYVVPSPSGNY